METHDGSDGSPRSPPSRASPAPTSGATGITLDNQINTTLPATLPNTISMDTTAQAQQLAQARLNALSRIIEFRTRNVSGANEQPDVRDDTRGQSLHIASESNCIISPYWLECDLPLCLDSLAN